MSSIMTSRQAAELDHAFERNGWTSADVKKLSQSDTLAQLLSVIKGLAEVKILKHIIDCDINPFVPDGWKVEEHKKGGQIKWNPEKIVLYLSLSGRCLEGNELRKKLKNRSVLNANILDYLLAHPYLIPEKWKGKKVFFWGTIYRSLDDFLYARCLFWSGGGWYWSSHWLGGAWCDDDPAVLPTI